VEVSPSSSLKESPVVSQAKQEEWEAVRRELDADRRRREDQRKTAERGEEKSLYDILQANKGPYQGVSSNIYLPAACVLLLRMARLFVTYPLSPPQHSMLPHKTALVFVFCPVSILSCILEFCSHESPHRNMHERFKVAYGTSTFYLASPWAYSTNWSTVNKLPSKLLLRSKTKFGINSVPWMMTR
jgi:hypothetical protein